MKDTCADLKLSVLTALAAAAIGCGEPEPIVTGAPKHTEQPMPPSVANIADPSQPVTNENRGDMIPGRHIPPANTDAPIPETDPE